MRENLFIKTHDILEEDKREQGVEEKRAKKEAEVGKFSEYAVGIGRDKNISKGN